MNEPIEYIKEVGLKSYDWSISRLDALNARIENLISWFTLINIAAITIAFNKYSDKLDFTHWTFYVTILLFSAFILGLNVLMYRAKIKLLGANDLLMDFYNLDKKNYLEQSTYWMGQHFENNLQVINRLEILANWHKILFFVELIFLIIWIVCSVLK
jgi:hypothetical protein